PLSQGRHQLIGQVAHHRGPDELVMLGSRRAVGGQLADGEIGKWTRDRQSGDCAHGCREPASTSVRHGSLLNLGYMVLGRPACAAQQDADVIDGTGVTAVTSVAISNREPIATFVTRRPPE